MQPFVTDMQLKLGVLEWRRRIKRMTNTSKLRRSLVRAIKAEGSAGDCMTISKAARSTISSGLQTRATVAIKLQEQKYTLKSAVQFKHVSAFNHTLKSNTTKPCTQHRICLYTSFPLVVCALVASSRCAANNRRFGRSLKFRILDFRFYMHHHWPLLEKNRNIAGQEYLGISLLDLRLYRYHHQLLLKKNKKHSRAAFLFVRRGV